MLSLNEYNNCKLCPRKCGVDRNIKTGFCKQTTNLKIAYSGLHFGEEPLITKQNGSGTIFFTGCTLQCNFCQNRQISYENYGENLSIDDLAKTMLKLQNAKASNINFITATHFIPSICESLKIAKQNGLTIPIVWNTSGYENLETIDTLNEFVDIYLPDFKTLSPDLSEKLFLAKNYPEVTAAAIKKMVASKPLQFNSNNELVQGTIIRHLVLPTYIEESFKVIEYIVDHNLANKSILSVMTQFTPTHNSTIKSIISKDEYDKIVEKLLLEGFDNCFIQDFDENKVNMLPDFSQKKPFNDSLAKNLEN